MRLALVASITIATTSTLTSLSLAELVHAQKIPEKEKISISLHDQKSGNSWERNKQRYDWDRYDRDRYDRDRYDQDRYDRGRRSNYYDEINRLYRQVLGRNVDSEGLRTWSRQIERGRSLRDIRRELAYSREAAILINNIYRQALGRNVDRGGLRTWQEELARGRNWREVQRAIDRSPEIRRRRY